MADIHRFEAWYYYHIYNRGKEKQKLFLNTAEYKKIIKMMLYQKRRFKWFKIVSYCFLPDHFHIIVYISKANLELSKFMEIWTGQYARYVRMKRKHQILPQDKAQQKNKTRVFQSNFKAKKIDSYRRLNQCFFYVEQNALQHKLVDKKWARAFWSKPYSSNTIIDRNKIISYTQLDLDFFKDWEF